MDEQSGIESSRPQLSASQALCAALEAHQTSLYVQMSPLKVILPLLVAHVRVMETELRRARAAAANFERRLAAAEHLTVPAWAREPGPTDLQAKLAHVIDVGKAEGQL